MTVKKTHAEIQELINQKTEEIHALATEIDTLENQWAVQFTEPFDDLLQAAFSDNCWKVEKFAEQFDRLYFTGTKVTKTGKKRIEMDARLLPSPNVESFAVYLNVELREELVFVETKGDGTREEEVAETFSSFGIELDDAQSEESKEVLNKYAHLFSHWLS